MQELMSSPIYFWGVVVGLISAAVFILLVGGYMVITVLKVINKLKMDALMDRVCSLLENQIYANHKKNKDLALVAMTILKEMSPKRAETIAQALTAVSDE